MVGWNKMVAVVIDPYPNIEFYIVGDRDRTVPLRTLPDGTPIKSPHEKKVDLMHNLFARHTNANITSVRFPDKSTAADWTTYWKHELNRHSQDTLIVIYFHGQAGGRTDYSFNIPAFPQSKANANELIRIANRSKTDCTFLLDCHIRTRIPTPWSNKENNVEIIARGQVLQDHRGNVIPDKGGFTESLVRNLECFSITFKKRKKALSIPEALAPDKEMSSNPLRVQHGWIDKKVVFRIKISPVLTRMASGNGPTKLVFVKERIQAPGKVTWPLPVRIQIQEAEERGEMRARAYNMDKMPKPRQYAVELADEGYSEHDADDMEGVEGSEHVDHVSDGSFNGDGDGNDTLFMPQ
ncbi:hypothetical protein LTR97_001580 [Elasticomyces elasticus]|uniref:Uncharacterized protein n=1 Tax=Elasticomyces elasticus TaxID=574655 RepID=A0AAN7VX79_9PEZI|nr:hypothetical protein LTR97_001580 [Elasticomyces elasticus]